MLYAPLDNLPEIEPAKENEQYATLLLSYYDWSFGIIPIIIKLSQGLNCVPFPPFSFPMKFYQELSIVRNDQTVGSLTSTRQKRTNGTKRISPVYGRKTELITYRYDGIKQERQPKCPIHKINYSRNNCRSFRGKTFIYKRGNTSYEKWISVIDPLNPNIYRETIQQISNHKMLTLWTVSSCYSVAYWSEKSWT